MLILNSIILLLVYLASQRTLAAPQSQPLDNQQQQTQQPQNQEQPQAQQKPQQQSSQSPTDTSGLQDPVFIVAPSQSNPLASGRAAGAAQARPSSPGATNSSAPPSAAATISSIDATNKQLERVPARDENFEVLDYNEQLSELKALSSETDNLFKIAHHHNNDELHSFLQRLATAYPEITRLYSIGETVEKRKLWVLLITEEPDRHVALKPDFRYIANMHGNEVVGRELLLQLARLILENYDAAMKANSTASPNEASSLGPTGQKFIRKLVKGTRIHLMPSMNPDGYARSTVSCMFEEPTRKGRVNANGVDLNRNFPDVALNTHIDAGTQPETRAVIDWSKSTPFVLSANIHGGALLVNFPYDSSVNKQLQRDPERRAPDHSLFQSLAKVYSHSHPTMWTGKMCYDQCAEYHKETFEETEGVTTGAAWYSVHGGMQDWMYNNTNDYQVTLELGCNQYPSAESLPDYWEKNKRALLNYMRQVHRGIKGTILDDQTNKPLSDVTIYVGKVDKSDSSKIEQIEHNVTSNVHGEYFRLLEAGEYFVQFVHPHYQIERVHVNSGNGMAQIHNIRLRPLDSATIAAIVAQSNSASQTPAHIGESAGESDDHSLAVATLIMTVIIIMLLLSMLGAFLIQRQRYSRSQSVSVELQPRSTSTGVSLAKPTSSGHRLSTSGSTINTTLST